MRTQAVFLDALGTLLELEPPWLRLARSLPDESVEDLTRAMRVEMAYYREHAHEGSDDARLADLRSRCAALLSRELGREIPVATMMSAIRFEPFPDARPALERLRARGLTLVCVSNWDASLPDVLRRAGLGELLDSVVSSAAVGAPKPDPAIFFAALAVGGWEPGAVLHVGDTPEEDVAGARAAGIPALWLDRGGGGQIASLAEIDRHLHP